MVLSVETTGILSVILFLVVAVGTLANLIVFILAVCSSRLRRPRHLPLLLTCCADFVSQAWTLPVALTTFQQGQWNLGSEVCTSQPVVRVFGTVLAQLCLVLAVIERYLQLVKPWRHEQVVTDVGAGLLAFGVILFSLVIGCFPLMGFGTVTYLSDFLQCTFDSTLSLSHLNFLFIFSYLIPLVIGLSFMAVSIHKTKKLKKASTQGGTVFEAGGSTPRESYADKLRREQARFKYAPMRGVRPTMSDSWSPDDPVNDGLVFSTYDEYAAYQRVLQQRRKVLRYDADEYKRAVMWWVAFVVHSALWLVWYVSTYMWSFARVWSGPAALTYSGALLAASSTAYRPLLYFGFLKDLRVRPDGCRRREKHLA